MKKFFKKGIFFSLDALIAIAIVIMTIIALKYIPTENNVYRIHDYSEDIMKILASTKMKDVNNSYVNQLRANNLISNENNTVHEKIRQFDEESYPGYNVYKIAVLHSNVTPKTVEKITDFTYKSLTEDFPDIDMFILGHYHVGYDTTIVKRENGKQVIFINNWNFTRVVRDYEVELDEHTPEFEHIQIQYDKINKIFIPHIENIQIPFVPYQKAFSAKDIDILKKSKKEIFDFFDNIDFEAVKDDSKKGDESLVEKIVENNGFDKESMECSLEYLNNAKG